MSNLYWLDQIQPEDRSLVGNKAFHLARLLQSGYPVAPGFVISAQMLRKFLATVNWTEPLFADLPYSTLRLDIENPQQLRTIAQQIRRTIEASSLPPEWLAELKAAVDQFGAPVVILRPSLALREPIRPHSSQFEPVIWGRSSALFDIQVSGITEENLSWGLRRLWADLFGAKSLFYWQRSGIPLQKVRLGVLVQPLWSAIAAGTVQANEAYFSIQAAPGLGMAIAWGEVTPDVYQVHSSSGTILYQQSGTKTIAYEPGPHEPEIHPARGLKHDLWLQSRLLNPDEQFSYALDNQQLDHLVQLTQRLIADLGVPLDIEWTLCHSMDTQSGFYLTQVIPSSPTVNQPVPRFETSEPAPTSEVFTPVNSRFTHLLSGLAVSQGRAIARARVIPDPNQTPVDVVPGTVLVASVLMPQWLPWIKQSAAIVTEQGSITSHSAIIAREVGVPAVMGVNHATQLIQTGDLVMVDGEQGRVYRLEPGHGSVGTEHPLAQPKEDSLSPHSLSISEETPLHSTSLTTTPDRPLIGTRLMVNLSQPESLAMLENLPIDGIGLLRSELLMVDLLENQHPGRWLQQGRGTELVERLTQILKQFVAALAPRPIYYRSLDWRSHEFHGLEGGEGVLVEANPVLGMRGTFSYMKQPALFELELAALANLQQSGYTNIRLMLPFVRRVEEFCFCRQRAELAGLTRDPGFQLWIMAEVPSVLFLLPEYVNAGVQGISIGSNDLTQLLLGVDRDNAAIAEVFDERHPAVKAAIAQLIQQAHQLGIPCSICGQAPTRYPDLVEDLVRWGIDTLSVDLEAVEPTYWAISRAERRLLLEASRQP
ncbi:hypothetical protein J5X98_11755 [Leptothermofonsia sichuanensis E412]|uniref:putative PEP-binding protein n=1 Tax=Leptothermofonsia sichuanensis TaxID=2917832 RepID=UPI001CA66729|nr:putative PEP-binding protein [Leptothermofonsia sichuanensis]QZZ22954.1 hypothetical protein J5X98_11755 [Leptothermofonsia sichuanensis E412]